jgi:hypothetical protein
MSHYTLRSLTATALAASLLTPPAAIAANHREAPITALDHKADITDWYSFVSYDDPSKVTMILCVDPLLEPANGPTLFPFDPGVLDSLKVDNNFDAREDTWFEVRFVDEQRLPGVFVSHVGAGNGLNAPPNSPKPVPPGTPIVPPAITALDGPGSEGIGYRQRYSVWMAKRTPGGVVMREELTQGLNLFAVPSNVGPRTMPDYPSLAAQGIYNLPNGIRVFAGTTDDAFWIDLGAAFDSLNFRVTGFPVPGVLSDTQDADDTQNFASDTVSGFNVNTIAIEVPIRLLTQDGQTHPPNDPLATIGTWGTTSRRRMTVRRSPLPAQDSGPFRQVQRMGNPLFNELLIGIGSKDRFSMDQPGKDSQFSNFYLDPLLARVLNAIYNNPPFPVGTLNVPDAPRLDLAPLVQYAPPIAAPGTPAGPLADLLRLNTGVPPTPAGQRSRLGLLAGDAAGFPNGRRVSDDVTDISARAVAGVLAGPPFNGFPNNRIGDGVNANDNSYQEAFPYVAFANDGRNGRHINPGEPGGGPIE